MSLYHEAADILNTIQKDGGSLKSLIFSKKNWKSDPKTLFALTTEAAKWSEVLSEVVEKSGILKAEKNLSPTLALLLTHDLFLAKKGIALPQTHGLNSTVSRHKVRLSAELTKARLRRGFSTLDALREHINSEVANGPTSKVEGVVKARHPRWIRINVLRTTVTAELETTFATYTHSDSLQDIRHAAPGSRVLHVDLHVPNLIAIAGPDDQTSFKSYKEGKLILQEKASCFPAYLLDPRPDEGDVIDACAAPGNKTTHVAALLPQSDFKVTACEKDPERSKTLEKMVKLAGADKIVRVKQKQDFLRLKPGAKEFGNVTALLLDPSCSGSGIVGRDESTIVVRLPSVHADDTASKGKKRKRSQSNPEPVVEDVITEETPDNEADDGTKLHARLEKLSAFQLRLLQHAMSFPAARKITYSTCSVHAEENENVVVKALLSDVAASRGWRVMKRSEQVEGMSKWRRRGVQYAVRESLAANGPSSNIEVAEVADACIRCEKGGEDGTMGFFVAGFVRDGTAQSANGVSSAAVQDDASSDEAEWDGFSDDET